MHHPKSMPVWGMWSSSILYQFTRVQISYTLSLATVQWKMKQRVGTMTGALLAILCHKRLLSLTNLGEGHNTHITHTIFGVCFGTELAGPHTTLASLAITSPTSLIFFSFPRRMFYYIKDRGTSLPQSIINTLLSTNYKLGEHLQNYDSTSSDPPTAKIISVNF